MKIFNLLLIVFTFFTVTVFGQDSELLGEDFDLEALPGVLEKVRRR